MSKYRRYERYKDSGVEWIGEIPEHWEVKKLKHISNITMGQSPKSEECSLDEIGLPFLQGNAEFTSLHPIPKMYCNTANKFSKINDILLSVRAPVGAMNISDRVYGIGRGLCAVTANKVQVRYLWYSMNVSLEELFIKSKGSTFEAVTVTDVNNLLSILPPKKEQIAIANFLDQKTTEIDGLIADKEKLIELLQEKRQAIISETVTKGLNPSVRMKDSGIEWIGDIPEHWDIRRIKYLSNIRNVKASDSDNDKTYVGLESIESKTGKLLTNNNDEQQAVGETANIFRKGDVLFGKLRPYLAKCIVADFNGRCTSELLVLRTASNMLPEYLYLFMLSPIFIDVVNSSTYGVKMPRASWDFIGNLKVPLPNIKEQEEIVEYLIKLTNNIDDLISDISTQIQKLKEYRQSLISEAVTGKIDVGNLRI
ncbi:restriction endonuclease subunit S [Clostridium sp. Cult2]|uniref:restriction endonuclease subunit S n=1 Tax=Clostridium sp. Cult2 TaxID=2079003 RepID=UPI001F02B579|nr:restriction endonuclease subunit S [Clostridium sp. Cult2]MCF6466613.1 restriction endonuclease subunit S [Clostridium sp. Cult2]